MKVGVVGLGRMGAALWRRLSAHGFDLVGWDRDSDASERSAQDGLRILNGAQLIACQAEVIISIITDDSGARALFCGPGGFLSVDVEGKLFVEMSTLQPMTTRELAAQVAEKGARLIDAPVLGTIPTVQAGKLVVMAGGNADDIDKARPVLDKLARRIIHMGPIGSGHAMKLSANIGLAAYVQAVAESLALGCRQGLDLRQMVEVLGETATATPWLEARASMLTGQEGGMTLDIQTMRKDVMSAVATAALSGIGTPLSAGALASLSAAVALDHGGKDIAELPRVFREQMGQILD